LKVILSLWFLSSRCYPAVLDFRYVEFT